MQSKLIILFFLMSLILAACNPIIPIPTFTTIPTFTATPKITPTNTAAPCAWNWAYGDTSNLDYRLQEAFANADIAGVVGTSSYGETGGANCSYHEMNLTVGITVYVADTTDLPALAKLATRIEGILQNQVAPYGNKPSLTEQNSTLTFKGVTGSASKACLWDFKRQVCQ